MKNETESKLIKEIFANSHNIAVIGVKNPGMEPAYNVPMYMYEKGYHIFPVNPKLAGKSLFNEKAVSNITEITSKIDLVNIFRRPEFIYAHAEEILKMTNKPKYVWLQEGIFDDDAAKLLEAGGIKVIQNRCIMVEHGRLM